MSQLTQLLEQQDYSRCLDMAAELLRTNRFRPMNELAVIHHAVCRSKIGLSDFLGAMAPGEEAVQLARQADCHDLLGRALLDLGYVYANLRRYDRAITTLHQYFEYKPFYVSGLQYEGKVWYNLGWIYQKQEDWEKAKGAITRAQEFWVQADDAAQADACRRRLIALLLSAGELDQVPVLLEEGDAYIQAHSDDAQALGDYLYDAADYYYRLGDHGRSISLAVKALDAWKSSLQQQHHAHMLLYRNAMALGHYKDALGFALSARIAAIDCRSYDLEYESASAMIRLIQSHGPSLLEELEAEYQSYGLDVYQFVPEALLKVRRRPSVQ